MTEPVPPEAPASIDEVLAEEAQTSPEVSPGSRITGGERPSALDNAGANDVAAERRPTVLVLVGDVGSGKTSIYAAIYERLGRGPFGGWMFAGSRTIPGFEWRCHGWRTDSGLNEPYMRHTNAQELPWLHIRLRDVEGRLGPNDLLLGDFDGEIFQQVRDGRRSATALPYLRRADHVGLVIDGSRLADSTTRASERQNTQYLLEALLEPEAMAEGRAMSLIVTKTDLFDGPDVQDIEACVEQINQAANDAAGRSVPLLRLAVRSHSAQFPIGHGLETLLEIMSLNPAIQIGREAPTFEKALGIGRFRA